MFREWRGELIEADTAEALPAGAWDLALVDLSGDLMREFVSRTQPPPGWVLENAVGLVPISISNDLRTALRRHFRLLVNKPVHHAALFALLAGTRKRAPVPAARPNHPGLRVLVAEDNLVNQRLIKRVLENLGCLPTLVEDGRQALDVLTARAAEFDLVLLDMHMPEMDGIEALRAIRAGQAGEPVRNIWIVALTADAREQQRAQAMEAGLNGYLTKPLILAELDAALRQFREEQIRRQA